MLRALLLVVVLVVGAASPTHARSLRDQLRESSLIAGLVPNSAFDTLADNIADSVARNLPVISASSGFTYRYNPAAETFELTSETLGPIFLERAETLGRSKFNVGVSYQYVQYDQYDGDSIKHLASPYPIIAGSGPGASAWDLTYRLGIQNHIVAFSGTYGILDDLDVNLLVPIIETRFRVGVDFAQRFVAGDDGVFVPETGVRGSDGSKGNAFGIGDTFLRLKYAIPGSLVPDTYVRPALGLQIRIPTGDEDNFHGTGTTEVSPGVFLSTTMWDRVTAYFNGAVDLDSDDIGQSQGRYGVGADVDVTGRVGIALAFLGRSEFDRSAKAGATDFPHLVNGQPEDEPLLGIEFDRKDYFDGSFGVRVVIWRQIMLLANGIVALNKDGLRNATVIPTVGVEGTF